jgi:hypothetical protein
MPGIPEANLGISPAEYELAENNAASGQAKLLAREATYEHC